MLVWTFILERTVVVYLASTYPKNDLQSRGLVLARSEALTDGRLDHLDDDLRVTNQLFVRNAKHVQATPAKVSGPAVVVFVRSR